MKPTLQPKVSRERTSPKNPSGFTLIELLTVIAIIGILASILIPVVGRVRDQARKASCISNVRQFVTASLLYADENQGKMIAAAGYPHSFTNDSNAKKGNYPLMIEPYMEVRLPGGAMYCPGRLGDVRNYDSPEYNRLYITYQCFNNDTLRGKYPQIDLSHEARMTPGMPIWGCLTFASGNLYFGHDDPGIEADAHSGMNAGYPDGSVRWVTELEPYGGTPGFYWPKPPEGLLPPSTF